MGTRPSDRGHACHQVVHIWAHTGKCGSNVESPSIGICIKMVCAARLEPCTFGSCRRAADWIDNVPSAFQPRSFQRSLHSTESLRLPIAALRSFPENTYSMVCAARLAPCTFGSCRRAADWIDNVPSAFQPRSFQRSLHSTESLRLPIAALRSFPENTYSMVCAARLAPCTFGSCRRAALIGLTTCRWPFSHALSSAICIPLRATRCACPFFRFVIVSGILKCISMVCAA